MIATLITTNLLRAGFRVAYLANPAPVDEPLMPVPSGLANFEPASLELALALYVPSLGRCVEPGGKDWPEDPATGLLTADVLVVSNLAELAPHSEPWAVEFMREGDWTDVKDAGEALHEIVAGSFAAWRQAEQRRRETGARGSPLSELEALEYPCEFIGLWSVSTSTDWESGHTDIDSIDFTGEGQIVPVPRASTAPAPQGPDDDLVRAALNG